MRDQILILKIRGRKIYLLSLSVTSLFSKPNIALCSPLPFARPPYWKLLQECFTLWRLSSPQCGCSAGQANISWLLPCFWLDLKHLTYLGWSNDQVALCDHPIFIITYLLSLCYPYILSARSKTAKHNARSWDSQHLILVLIILCSVA